MKPWHKYILQHLHPNTHTRLFLHRTFLIFIAEVLRCQERATMIINWLSAIRWRAGTSHSSWWRTEDGVSGSDTHRRGRRQLWKIRVNVTFPRDNDKKFSPSRWENPKAMEKGERRSFPPLTEKTLATQERSLRKRKMGMERWRKEMAFKSHRLLNWLQIGCYLFGAFFPQRLLGKRHWPSGIYSELKVLLKLPACGFKLLAGRLVITAYRKQYVASGGRWLGCWSGLTCADASLTERLYCDCTTLCLADEALGEGQADVLSIQIYD